MSHAKRLWDKGEDVNVLVHRFTVADDPVTDLELLHFDLLGSAAHARMLYTQGLLTREECLDLLRSLNEISDEHTKGNFEIPYELEDCHTAIESALTEKLGDTGKKIHTGRSRNDQVLLCSRLYIRAKLIDLFGQLLTLAQTLLTKAEAVGHVPMPGYTHLQAAMPSSSKLWLCAFVESTIELAREACALTETVSLNPLGAASGFGSNLPIDRSTTTKLLAFNRVQRNPIAVQNSRGFYELKVLRLASDVAFVIEKMAWDLIIFNTAEFSFVSLPQSLTTGSSIMPQKRNPDVLELLRAKAAKVRAAETELGLVIAKLPSNYHRDFQFTKEPLVRGLRHVFECLPIAAEVVRAVSFNPEAMRRALTDDLYSTYDAYRQVREGVPFRDAYKVSAERVSSGTLNRGELEKEFEYVAKACDQDCLSAWKDIDSLRKQCSNIEQKLNKVEALLGQDL